MTRLAEVGGKPPLTHVGGTMCGTKSFYWKGVRYIICKRSGNLIPLSEYRGAS